MLQQDQKDQDDEVEKKAKGDPNINELDVGGLREICSNRVVESVHDQHGGDSDRNTCFEMFLSKVKGSLKVKNIIGQSRET